MPSPKTVFVVGAGASYEFGLPVGNQLKSEIATCYNYKFKSGRLTDGDGYLYEVLESYTHYVNRDASHNELINAARYISAAMPLAPSIDNFIHVNNGKGEVELCGKLAIAHNILRAEAKSKLRIPNEMVSRPEFSWIEDTWLVSFMKMLGEDCNITQLADRLSSITFIVFNYDRCIEHFLFHAIQLYYGVNATVAGELLNKLSIFHPYGVVSRLPWQDNPDRKQTISFGGSPDHREMLKVATEIKTFTEGTDEHSSDIIAIRNAIALSERMVFLGFAYHRLNLSLLFGKMTLVGSSPRHVIGTAFGMSDSDTDAIRNNLGTRLLGLNTAIKNNIRCAELFHEYSRALAFV